jgi:hypothetical protein
MSCVVMKKLPNVCGVVITTNHKTDGIYLPADDRRHYVALCGLTKEDFRTDYWNTLYQWYERDGYCNVAAYLAQLDLSDFDPKAPPPNTPAFWAIVDANRSPEDAELADVLDHIGKVQGQTPVLAVTLQMLTAHATGEFQVWLQDRKNRRVISHRLEPEYTPVKNPDAGDGLWKVMGKRQAVYAHSRLSVAEQIRSARVLTDQSSQ